MPIADYGEGGYCYHLLIDWASRMIGARSGPLRPTGCCVTAMSYASIPLPFRSRKISAERHVAVAATGDHAFLTSSELAALSTTPGQLSLERQAYLRSRFLLRSATDQPGLRRLAASRIASKRETVTVGPSLHILVPTLQCAHSCKYCQVSRRLEDSGAAMSEADLDLACDTIFESPSKTLTVEFQGGDPLLRFDLVSRAIQRIAAINRNEHRHLRFVVASTLHQLTADMCTFFVEHGVFLSTSIDGPCDLHNRNRPTPTRDAYQRTVAAMTLARQHLGHEGISALMTTTRESLSQPEAIVDEYVRLGLRDIFLRPLSLYGFAKRNQLHLAYTQDEFASFYRRAFERVLHWNREGVEIREAYACVVLNKILSTFDAGYVDLQSPTGAGSAVIVYNYDGYIYPSDEARMVAEAGDLSLRMGRIGTPLSQVLASDVRRQLANASRVDETPGCADCAYNLFCAPNPIDAYAQTGTMTAPVLSTEHCRRHMWMFDSMFQQLDSADPWTLDLFHCWASPSRASECAA